MTMAPVIPMLLANKIYNLPAMFRAMSGATFELGTFDSISTCIIEFQSVKLICAEICIKKKHL